MSEFKTIDDAIAAVDGTVTLSITQWDDGFTWEIIVTSQERNARGAYDLFEFQWDEGSDEKALKTATEAGIAACEVAIEGMKDD